jgi:hypothetical protein
MTDDERTKRDERDEEISEIENPEEKTSGEAPLEALTMKNSFGTAVGAAMLGFEQALRREPPPEVLAAEHVPERGHVTCDGDEVTIEFPDPVERR